MQSIKAKKIDFIYRLLISSGFYLGLIMFLVLELLLLSKTGLDVDYFALYQICLIILLAFFFAICFNKSTYYLDKIELGDQSVLLDVYKFDELLETIEITFLELTVDLKMNLSEKYPRYTLELKSKKPLFKNGNRFSIKQYEIGFWNKENLKKAHKLLYDEQHK